MVVKKKGFLVIDVLVYLSIASILILCVMNLGVFINKGFIGIKKISNDMTEYEKINFELDNLLNGSGNKSYINNKGTIMTKKLDGRTVATYKSADSLVIDNITYSKNINKFKATEFENLIYIEMEFENGNRTVSSYEK